MERHSATACFHRDLHIVKLIGGNVAAHGDSGFHFSTVPALHQHAAVHVYHRDVPARRKLKALFPDAFRPVSGPQPTGQAQDKGGEQE